MQTTKVMIMSYQVFYEGKYEQVMTRSVLLREKSIEGGNYTGEIGKLLAIFLSLNLNDMENKIIEIILFSQNDIHKAILEIHKYLEQMTELSNEITRDIQKPILAVDNDNHDILNGTHYIFNYYRLLQKYAEQCVVDAKYNNADMFLTACNLNYFNLPEYENKFMPFIQTNEEVDVFTKIIRFQTEIDYNLLNKKHDELMLNKSLRYRKYKCTYSIELFTAMFYEILLNCYIIKKCENCNRFFIPYSRSDEKYCDNISPQDETRTCKKYANERLWYERMKLKESKMLYRKVYSAKRMYVSRHLNNKSCEDKLRKFITEADIWQRDVDFGIKQEAEYIEWLNEQKSRRV